MAAIPMKSFLCDHIVASTFLLIANAVGRRFLGTTATSSSDFLAAAIRPASLLLLEAWGAVFMTAAEVFFDFAVVFLLGRRADRCFAVAIVTKYFNGLRPFHANAECDPRLAGEC